MPRTCSICSHEQRAEIDAELIAETPLRNIAERFGTSSTTLHRHRQEHLPSKMVKAKEAEEEVEATDLLSRLRALNEETRDVLRAAKKSDAHGLRLQAIQRLERQLELEARLLGELIDQQTVNVILSPEWLVVRTALLQALSGYPEARQAVSGALLELEAS